MNKFKPGQKVICINKSDDSPKLTVGEIYLIDEINDECLFILINDEGYTSLELSEYFQEIT